MHRLRQHKNNERAFVVVLTAISGMTIAIICGLAIDLGAWYLSASKLQRASDAAALAGATALPDVSQAQLDAASSLERNGYKDGQNSIGVVATGTSDKFSLKLTDSRVPVYFLKLVMPNITISRQSTAVRSHTPPTLGSPFNVLGTGDLSIPGLPQHQNFWLAMNARCDAKEDGDFFTSEWDSNKELSGVFNGHNNEPTLTSRHHCTSTDLLAGQIKNPNYNPSGYSYVVDIPKPLTAGTNYDISVYDAAYTDWHDPDKDLTLNGDYVNYPSFVFQVWKTNDTLYNEADDTLLVNQGMNPADLRGIGLQWHTLYTVPYADIASNGGQYRVQVTAAYTDIPTAGSLLPIKQIGANAFSLGAFKNGSIQACDSRTNPECPRIAARGAISVYNNLTAADSNGTATFYFAEVDTSYVGSAINLQLWDPGEGVTKMEVLGPDGTPLHFDWSSGTDYSDTNVDFIDTSGSGPPAGPNLSNDYKFNDRLVSIHLVVPSNYQAMIDSAGGDKWLRIRYTVGSAPNDRTTWGITMDSRPGAPPYLARKG